MDENNYISDLDTKRLEIMLKEETNKVMIGDRAPSFTANSTFGKINLGDYSGKWLILFSHPGDFTPVWYL